MFWRRAAILLNHTTAWKNSWIQIVDFLKSWMHPRAPDATVFTRAKITFVADAQM